MKVKLIQVHTGIESRECSSYYEDVQRYVVDVVSPWEEISEHMLYQLETFLNRENLQKGGIKYLLIKEDQPRTIQMAISDMLEDAKKQKEKASQEQKKRDEKKRQMALKAAASKKERLEKQLRKLQETLATDAITKDAQALIEGLSK